MEIQRNARNIKDMSEEEKKAIHLLQSYTGMTHKLTDNQGRPKLDQAIEKALNLIEKQQQEIEKLKNTETYKIAIIDKDKYVSKDKIKEIINKLKNNDVEYSEHIAMLEELLEERN